MEAAKRLPRNRLSRSFRISLIGMYCIIASRDEKLCYRSPRLIRYVKLVLERPSLRRPKIALPAILGGTFSNRQLFGAQLKIHEGLLRAAEMT